VSRFHANARTWCCRSIRQRPAFCLVSNTS
jgi:hypothetical protein